jgi:hypothetical protein
MELSSRAKAARLRRYRRLLQKWLVARYREHRRRYWWSLSRRQFRAMTGADRRE